MGAGQRIGYVRVSSLDQNTARQLDGVHVDKLFEDKASGKDANRPQLLLMLDFVREGDTVIIHSMDRLASNVDDLRRLVKTLTAKGVQVQFIKESLNFKGEDSAIANMMLTVMGAVAEFERALIGERQREGIALAKTNGAYKGRKKTLTARQTAELQAKVAAGVPKAKVARDLGLSRETVYSYFMQDKQACEVAAM